MAEYYGALGGVEFSLALGDRGLSGNRIALACYHLGLGTGNGGDGLLRLSTRRVALGVEHVHLHLRQRLPGLHKITFVHHDILHASGELGGNVNFGRLHASVAAHKTNTGTGRF